MSRRRRAIASPAVAAWVLFVLSGFGPILLAGCGQAGRSSPSSSHLAAGHGVASNLVAPLPEVETGPRDPGADGPHHGFYPLRIGNRWHYEITTRLVLLTNDGPRPIGTMHSTLATELVGTETLFGRLYTVELDSTRLGFSPKATIQWFRYRQDRGGLYAADVDPSRPPGGRGTSRALAPSSETAVSALEAEGGAYIERSMGDPAQRAAFRKAWHGVASRLLAARRAGIGASRPRPGPLDHEFYVLRYPLHPGTRWVIQTSPPIGFVVEGYERLTLAVGCFGGFRIRQDWALLGPNDWIRMWFGRAGYLKSAFHAEGEATDEQGQLLGWLIVEETLALDGIRITRGDHRAADDEGAPGVGAGTSSQTQRRIGVGVSHTP